MTDAGPIDAVEPKRAPKKDPTIRVVHDDEYVDERPLIVIRPGTEGLMLRKAEETIGGTPNVFQRNKELVTIAREAQLADVDDTAESRDKRSRSTMKLRAGTPHISIISPPGLRVYLSDSIRWQKYNRKLELVEASPNPDTVGSLLAFESLHGWPHIKLLNGLRECPFLTPRHRIVTAPGYDPETGFYLIPSINVGEIPEAPTQEQSRAALRYLWTELFVDFPFNELGESSNTRDEAAAAARFNQACEVPAAFVAIAAMLTIIARPAISGAILSFLFEANTPGAGKSLQSHLISIVTTGRAAGVASYPMGRDGRTNDEEMAKVLGAYALAGSPIVAFDNIKGEIGGGALEGAMTAVETAPFRRLGVTELVDLPWSATLLLTGNNAMVSEDTAQRVLLSRLESEFENPREKTAEMFRNPNVKAFAREHRATLVRACLIILKAYLSRTSKVVHGTIGSYEEWSQIIPGAIIYAGGPDVTLAQPKASEVDSGLLDAHGDLMRAWPFIDFPNGAKLDELLKFAFANERAVERGECEPDGHENLRAAIRAITETRQDYTPDLKSFSYAVRGLKGKWRDGYKLETTESHGHRRWRVVFRQPRRIPDPTEQAEREAIEQN